MARIVRTEKHIITMEITTKHPDNGFSAIINALTHRAYKELLYMTTNNDGYKVKVGNCWISVERNVYGSTVAIECSDKYEAEWYADKIEQEFKKEDKGIEGEETEVRNDDGKAEDS